MAKANKSESVPKAMQAKYDSIVAITDAFAAEHLVRYAAAALARKCPSPLSKGQAKSWACGITHAIGMVNFLSDPASEPYMSAADLYAAFSVSASTGGSKSKQVRDLLGMFQLSPDWSTSDMIDRNPLAWMVEVNGLIMDIRRAPRPLQEIAYEKGLIPYLPEETISGSSEEAVSSKASKSETAKSKAQEQKAKKGKAKDQPSADALYILAVLLIGGPVTEAFIEENPTVLRTILIKGSQTLGELHYAIFDAFDREDEHMYEFQLGGSGPNDPAATRYGLKSNDGSIGDYDADLIDARTTAINDLNLSKGDVFGYWFDFGDDWWHQIEVVSIRNKAPKGNKYPKVSSREGASPPQYPDWDEEV